MDNKIEKGYIYLDTYVVQKDMRIRLPKVIQKNMDIVKGKTEFDIYMKNDKKEIVLKLKKTEGGKNED